MYGMKEQKLTLRISQEVLDEAKRYAREHGTSLTRLVTTYLEGLEKTGHGTDSAPITRGLAGSLPPTVDRSEHWGHLESRHG
jgi:hypothetical protein